MCASRILILLCLITGLQSLEGKSQCSVIEDQIDTYLYTDQDFGQSFKACEDGRLTNLDFPMHHFLTGDIQATMTVFHGEGYTGEEIYSAEITLIDEWGSSVAHELSDTVLVYQGESYTFRVEYFEEYGVMWGNFTDGYEDGNLYWNGEMQETVDMGFTALIEPSSDIECVEWNGQVSQDWNDPFNWTPAIVPDSTDCVSIIELSSAYYPRISGNASAAQLNIEPEAQLLLEEGALLSIHGQLNSYGDGDYRGVVVVKEGTSPSEINGSPIFDQLRIEGLLFTTEPIEVLNILDLSEGYLANFGTELYLNTGNGYQGHAYIPNDIIVGHVIIKKHIEEFGEQIIGLPFQEMDEASLLDGNELGQLMLFDQVNGIENFNENWTVSPSYVSNGFCDAIRTSTAESIILLEGETTNDEMTVIGDDNLGNEEPELQLISNPFPSVLSLDRLSISEGASQATYKWMPTKKQFGSRIDGYNTHGMDGKLYPTEALMVQLGSAEQLKFIYNESALEPLEVFELQEESVIQGHQLKLSLESSQGRDEMIIRLDMDASFAQDSEMDALKIPSLDPTVPTMASVIEEGHVLSINTMPYPQLGSSIPLYVTSGVEGVVQFRPLLVDIGGLYDQVLLYDEKHDLYHDLIEQGVYQTELLIEDGVDRFSLYFGAPSITGDGPDQDAVFTETEPVVEEELIGDAVETEEEEWVINTFLDQISIMPLTSIEPEESYYRVTIFSSEGKLVFDRQVSTSEREWSQRLHVGSGVYMLDIVQGDKRQSQKIWLSR